MNFLKGIAGVRIFGHRNRERVDFTAKFDIDGFFDESRKSIGVDVGVIGNYLFDLVDNYSNESKKNDDLKRSDDIGCCNSLDDIVGNVLGNE